MNEDDKRFPARGKWDFSDDELRLKAIKYTTRDHQYGNGYSAGRRAAVNWARPIAFAAVAASIVAAFTVLAINRPDLIKWPEPTVVGTAMCYSGNAVWPSLNGRCFIP